MRLLQGAERLLMIRRVIDNEADDSQRQRLRVVRNWIQELTERVPRP